MAISHRATHSSWAIIILVAIFSSIVTAMLCQQRPAYARMSDSQEVINQKNMDIIAFPVQLPNSDGIVMIDSETSVMCIYEYQYQRPVHERLVLLAARNCSYDLQLQEYNTAEPTPAKVCEIINNVSKKQETNVDSSPAVPEIAEGK